jgi:tetratricopeptide (TPR) repeat protein
MSIERGSLLFQTGRHELAEQEFRAALVQEPSNALAHAMVALCLLSQKKYAEATTEAQQAIALRPDWDVGYSALAAILSARERLKDAVLMAERAIQLDPFDPEHHALLAAIRNQQRNWPAALAAADAGLAINPEHSLCINARGIALVNLGRRDEASATIGGALQRDPHNATTHANQGWALLHAGDHKAALEHFREALRINPDLQWARAGIVEALKARNIIYRVMLKYFLFMSRMSGKVRWGIIIGLFAGDQLLHSLATSHPAISPWVTPIMVAYVAFALMTWLSVPLFNLMLRLDKYGRYALSRDQRVASNWIGVLLGSGVALAIMIPVRHDFRYLLAAILVAVLCIPVSAVFSCQEGWPRWSMTGYAAVLGILAAVIMTVSFMPQGNPNDLEPPMGLIQTFAIGLLLSQFVANWLITASVKR